MTLIQSVLLSAVLFSSSLALSDVKSNAQEPRPLDGTVQSIFVPRNLGIMLEYPMPVENAYVKEKKYYELSLNATASGSMIYINRLEDKAPAVMSLHVRLANGKIYVYKLLPSPSDNVPLILSFIDVNGSSRPTARATKDPI